MHILFIADTFTKGGATECLCELVGNLIGKGCEITVCTSQRSEQNERLESLGARTVVTHHGAFLYVPSAEKWKRPLKFIYCLFSWLMGRFFAPLIAFKEIQMDTVDLIHSNLPRNDLGLILSKKWGKPHVCHLRENSFEHFGVKSLRLDPIGYLQSRTNRFVAVSSATKQYWARLGIDATKISVVYDAVSRRGFRQINLEDKYIRASKDGCKGVFLGGCSTQKGVWDAVRAVEILAQCDVPFSLDIWGADGSSDSAPIEAYISERGLGDRIRVYGRYNEVFDSVWDLLKEYDIGLACSDSEAFGRVVVEFQVAGLAVVLSDRGSFPELIDDGVDGLLYSKDEGPASLALKIRLLVDNPEFRRNVQYCAQNNAERYSVEKNGDAIYEIYREIVLRNGD